MFDLHSAFWMNLHHYLHALARDNSPLVEPLPPSATAEERETWAAGIAYYRGRFGSRSLTFDSGLISTKLSLLATESADSLPIGSIAPGHRTVLQAAAAIYRKYRWPAHDALNRQFAASTEPMLSRYGHIIGTRLAASFGTRWPQDPIRVDLVFDAGPPGNAYTTNDPTHVTIGSGDVRDSLVILETLFHEASHGWDAILMNDAQRVASRLGVHVPSSLWHAVLFFNAGYLASSALREAGVGDYVMYADRGLFDGPFRGWRAPIATHWPEYLAGRIDRDEALGRIVQDIDSAYRDMVRAPLGDAPVADVANIRFHSAFWINLHHTLYDAAHVRRATQSVVDRPIPPGAPPAGFEAALTDDQRAAWQAAVDHYDRELAERNLRFGRGMTDIKLALVRENLADDAIGPHLRNALERAAPAYQMHLWPVHDRANREWIRATADSLRVVADATVPLLERLYGAAWFASPLRIDVTRGEPSFTTLFPTHATIGAGAAYASGWPAVEIVLHELSHHLVLPLQNELSVALGGRLNQHGALWHVIQFYLTGGALRDVLRARGINHTPLVYSVGLFDGVWSAYRKPVEEAWEPYLRGEIGRSEAIRRILAALPPPGA